ncbi:hypothetical protein GQ44DRAFT_294328 [Phaeosphaeriaceae sp. PMI808]|nr:hypothetical protein GQ44DRAFT_294328 [Phaeosphaeriaceae sp. PMI808]
MDEDYTPGICDHLRALSSLPEIAYENDVGIDGESSFRTSHEANLSNEHDPSPDLSASLNPTALQPSPMPYREWGDITMLGLSEVELHLDSLQARCSEARSAFNDVLDRFETSVQEFITKRAPVATEDATGFFQAFTAARVTAFAIFTPQEAYRVAITTFGMLFNDIINMLDTSSEYGNNLRAEFDEAMEKANSKEEAIRVKLRKLMELANVAGTDYALMVYMDTAKERLKNWREIEDRLRDWSETFMEVVT